jgi:thiosulfate dehydrogenase
MTRVLTLISLCAAVGCTMPAKEYGALAFHDAEFSGSQFNTWSCHNCHATRADDPRILPGASMIGVTTRAGWYGGHAQSLFDAVQFCDVSFMRASKLEPDDARAKALYEYLQSLSADPADALPFTIVGNVADVPRGDPDIGGEVYKQACHDCHGDLHTGQGRNTPRASLLPEIKEDYVQLFPGTNPAVVFVEKVRHGQFFGVGGNMPLYSKEALSDEQLGALLAYLGL